MNTDITSQKIKSTSPLLLAIILVATMLCASGCARRKLSRRLMPTPAGIAVGLPHPGGEFDEACQCVGNEIPVFIVSDRKLETKKRSLNPFGTKRSLLPSLGTAYVTIGDGLTPEELHEQTTTDKNRKKAKVVYKRIELAPALENANPWLVKDDVIRHNGNPWVQAVNRQLDRSQRRNVTIFVHGYNTELVDNTLIAGEIFHYLGHQGAMISFEWPSESRLLGYVADKGNADFSTRHFRSLIANVAKECNADSITIIAHSAGSSIVVNALRELRLLEYDLTAQQVQQKYRIDRVVLAAPDMDLMGFFNAIHDRFQDVAGRVAVYASPKDRALGISEKLNGSRRLGRTVNSLEPWEKKILSQASEIELIDASIAVEEYRTFIGHSYFHRDPWVSSDIGGFILGKPPASRSLVKEEGQIFWTFPKDYLERLEQRAALVDNGYR